MASTNDDRGFAEQCRELAALARLSLSDAEMVRLSAQLQQILQYLTQLRDVDVEDVAQWRPPDPVSARLRDDAAGSSLPVDLVLAQAARTRDGQILVPKFKDD